jgi:hypothetical protein
MIIITSIAPKHANDQKKAVESWLKLNLQVFSFNSQREIDQIEKDYKGVTFVETYRTMELSYGKPVVSISAMMDWCKLSNYDKFMFINSDIEVENHHNSLSNINELLDKNMVLANRLDYGERNNRQNTMKYYYKGIDVFCMNKTHLQMYGQSMYAMGQCFWDYWIPFTALKNGVTVYLVKHRSFYHNEHPLQYSNDNWLKTGRYFRIDNSLHQFDDSVQGIGRMSDYVYNLLYKTMVKKEL